MDKSNNQIVINFITLLSQWNRFFIEKNNIEYKLSNVTIDENGHLFHKLNNNVTSTNEYFKKCMGLTKCRWLNHLKYKDGMGNKHSVKQQLKKLGLNFS